MQTTPDTPWHKASFDRFLQNGLPELLSDRLPVEGYHAACCELNVCQVTLSVRTPDGTVEVRYPSLPAPDDAGTFRLDGTDLVVCPIADADDPGEAGIRCVGELLLDFIDTRLGSVPDGSALDAPLLRAVAPLEAWFRAFLATAGQPLTSQNWLDRHTWFRRLRLPDREAVFTPGHFGRTCPFETPEGPNLARILTISRGAEIRDGRLVVLDGDPVAGLGLTTSAIPFLEHDDGNRLLMGANMMRQWLPPAEREPALVQTGLEPDDPEFWAGRNLLTAFVSWDGYAHEDALVISTSCAQKLRCPDPLEPGDKLSNRHGAKGVVGRVLSDAEMPCMPDGTPVDLIYSLSGVPTRWALGQVREAAVSRAARAEGQPAVVPPFAAPSDEDLRKRLKAAGLPETGTEVLTVKGQPMRRGATVGCVYWGCTLHVVRQKLHAAVRPEDRGMRVGRMEVEALLEAGADVVARELTNTCATGRDDAHNLADRVAVGSVEQPTTPAPRFTEVRKRLASAGIAMALDGEGCRVSRLAAGDGWLKLAAPVAHPWLPRETLPALPPAEDCEAFRAVAAANDRLARLMREQAPEVLVSGAGRQLAAAVRVYFSGLLSRDDLRFGGQVLFSGRSVIAPGPDLRTDQLGVPEEMAWTLFGPRTARLLGDREAVSKRTPKAAEALEKVMSASWVILNRAPSVSATAMLAFRPVLQRERVIRLHPLACRLMNADFDGDQAAVYLPVTEAAQREAGERLTVEGHLRRDPGLIDLLYPSHDALFGLACLSLSEEGRATVDKAAGRPVGLDDGIVTHETVVAALRGVLRDEGPASALAAADRLMRAGFRRARAEGGSIGPFLGSSVSVPDPPVDDDLDQWLAYQDEVHAIVAGFRDYGSEDLGAVALLCHSGARGNIHQVAQLIAPQGPVRGVDGTIVEVRHCWREGLTPAEAMARVVGARKGLHRILQEYGELGEGQEARQRPDGYGVLCRARRASAPGVVFARAARMGEVDPLTDRYARLFVGLPGRP